MCVCVPSFMFPLERLLLIVPCYLDFGDIFGAVGCCAMSNEKVFCVSHGQTTSSLIQGKVLHCEIGLPSCAIAACICFLYMLHLFNFNRVKIIIFKTLLQV